MLSKTVTGFAIVLIVESGSQSAPPRKLLSAPTGVLAPAAQHNKNQWAHAKQHIEAAITAAPSLAEGNYNLGMLSASLRSLKAGVRHFIETANLAPGHKVIWDSPALKHVSVPEKEVPGMSDGLSH